MKNIYFLIVLFSPLFNLSGQQQSLISNSGSNFTNSSFQLSWSMGEPIVESLSQSQFILNQGFQQGDLKVATNEAKIKISEEFIIFPIPAKTILHIQSNGILINDLYYSINNLNGIKLSEGRITSLDEKIDLTNLQSGTYTIKIFDKNYNYNKTFKIIKL